MSTASEQRKLNRKRSLEKRRDEKLKKLRQGNKITTRKRVDGKIVKTDRYYGGNKISNIPKEGQRKLVLKSGLPGTFPGGLPSDYKKTEQEQINKVKKWRKSDEYKKIQKNKKGH